MSGNGVMPEAGGLRELADAVAPRGTVRHLMLRLGYFPRDEAEAEDLVARLVDENARLGGMMAKRPEGRR